MSPETWQTLGTIVALLVVGAYNAWRTIRAERAARKAVDLSRPTGNGFAQEVRDSLARIEGKADATNQLVINHLAAHAHHDLNRPPPAI